MIKLLLKYSGNNDEIPHMLIQHDMEYGVDEDVVLFVMLF
jgi:hypothetical protein